MSVNVELKTPNQNNITWSLSLKANSRIPIVAERTYATLADAQTWVNDLADDATAYAGAIVAVVEDGKNNGIYYVASIAQAATETTDFVPGVLVAAGAGAGSEAVANYEAALAAATADNLGQILYVTNPTYKKGEGTTLNPDEADVDEEGNKIVVYTAGPYIVTGAGAVAKLGTTSATGDIAGDVENLKGRVSTAEGEIDTLQTDVNTLKTTVGDADSGLVKDVADTAAEVQTLKSAVAGGVHFRGVVSELPWTDAKYVIDESSWEPNDADGLYTYKDYLDYVLSDGTVSYSVGDIVIVSPTDENGTDAQLNPSREYILVSQETEESADGDNQTIYFWEDLGDTTLEGQRISALESLIDSDKVATWNTGATQAATLTTNIGNYALKTEVEEGYVAKETGKSLVSNTLIAKLEGLKEIKGVDGVLSVDTDGTLKADLSGYVAKDTEYTNLVSKVGGVEAGAQVNKIEVVKVNGSALTIDENKAVDIDLVNHLAGKVSINGQVLAETDDNGVLAATIDASDIHLGTNIGDNDAATTTVQSLLASVYDTANSKLGSIYLAKDDTTTANVLALSKTNVANDTISFKIAASSALTATTNGLDLVWTEL